MFRYGFPKVGIGTVICCNEYKGCFGVLVACGICQKCFSGYMNGFPPGFNQGVMGVFPPSKVPVKLDLCLY